jgi:aryl-alcohol dehydrogenase-like predicted oxidoreductase
MAFDPVILPCTNLQVGPIGLGSSFGLAPEDVELAFDNGINYFYWGSIRRPGFGRGVRRLAVRHRDRMVVAVQSYLRRPAGLVRASFDLALRRLGLDYADILILGMYNQRPPQQLLDAALELQAAGRVRHLMMSGHRRAFFPEMAKENIFDLFMVRYNAANRGAEHDVFPLLPGGDEQPAICAYTATRWGSLIDAKKLPAGEKVPAAGDCYRFCLSNPKVDMVLSGPANKAQLREAMRALQAGPLNEDEMDWMQRVGAHVYGSNPMLRAED